MLINWLTCGNDYQRALKQRRGFSLAMLLVGLVGFVCYFMLVPGSSLSDHAQGFYLGAASGIVAGALVLLLRAQRLLSNPDARKKARIQEQDEREQYIINETAKFAGIFTFFAAAAALFVVLPLSIDAYYALLGVMVVYTACFVAIRWWLARKL